MIEVLSCGPLTSVQDNGRHGYRHLGVGQCGVVDPVAAMQANLLLGNSADAAILEFHFPTLTLHFSEATDVAFGGTDYQARRMLADGKSGELLTPGHVHHIKGGQQLRFGRPPGAGLFACLAVAGGIEVPVVMGSRSTDISAGFGGLEGRQLQSGDRLFQGTLQEREPMRDKGVRSLIPTGLLRAIAGPEFKLFRPQSQADLWQTSWRVSPDSNRMGTRLVGEALARTSNSELPSSAVLPGVIQVPGDGQPIILGNDAQTTGGYARIASVIRADLWQLAYLPPDSVVRLQRVEAEQAHAINAGLDRELQQLAYNIRTHGA